MHLIGLLLQVAILSRDFQDHAQQFNRPLGSAVDWEKVSTRQWKRESPTHLLAECIRKECEGNLPCNSSLLTEWSIWWSCADQRKHTEQQLLQYVPSNLSLGQVSCIPTGACAHWTCPLRWKCSLVLTYHSGPPCTRIVLPAEWQCGLGW